MSAAARGAPISGWDGLMEEGGWVGVAYRSLCLSLTGSRPVARRACVCVCVTGTLCFPLMNSLVSHLKRTVRPRAAIRSLLALLTNIMAGVSRSPSHFGFSTLLAPFSPLVHSWNENTASLIFFFSFYTFKTS